VVLTGHPSPALIDSIGAVGYTLATLVTQIERGVQPLKQVGHNLGHQAKGKYK
jgi:hypothetical protein